MRTHFIRVMRRVLPSALLAANFWSPPNAFVETGLRIPMDTYG